MKKLLSLSLAILLSFQTLYADDFFQTFGVSQITSSDSPFREHVGANGEKVYELGGRLTIKRDQPDFPQWFTLQPPSIDASCSGVDFKGMFGTIVNLDEIARQFEEAGASAAWGVLVGIIYSLPGIGEIFQQIDAWAKKIQSMLANSCNAGIALGKGLASSPVGDAALAPLNAVRQGADYVSKAVNDPDVAIGEIFDCSSEMWSAMAGPGSCTDIQESAGNSIGRAFTSFAPSIIGSTILSSYQETGVFINTITEKQLTTIDFNSTQTGLGALQRELAFALIVASSTGDIMVEEESVQGVATAFSVLMDSSKNSDEKTAAYKNATKGLEGVIENPVFFVPKIKPELMAKYLIYGNTLKGSFFYDNNASIPLSDDVANEVRLPRMHYYAESNTGSQKGAIAIIPSTGEQDVPNTIKSYITGYSGVYVIALKSAECYLEDINASCAQAGSSLVDADMTRYFAKVYRNTNGNSAKESLKNRYITASAYELSIAMIEKISEYSTNMKILSSVVKDSTGSSTTAPTASDTTPPPIPNQKEKFVAEINQRLESLHDELQETVEKVFDKHDHDSIFEIFEEQDRKNIRQAYENNG